MASGSLYKGSDGVYLHDCDVCLSQSTTPEAISYCSICREHLCQSCDKAHRGSRATKDHVLLTGNEVPSGSLRTTPAPSIMYCDVHKTTILNLYCKVHGEALCSTCKMTKHPRCDTIEVKGYIAQINVAERCSEVEANLDDLTSKINDFKKSRLTERSVVKTQIQKCLHDMQELRKTINDRMDELEQTLSSQLRDIEQTIDEEMNSNMATIDDIMQQTTFQKSLLNQYKNVPNDDVTFIAINKTYSRVKEYTNILDQLQKQVYDRDVCFQPDDVITDVLQQLTSLGTVVINKQSKYPSPVQTLVRTMSVVDKQEIDVGSCNVNGCTFTSDGHLVLACADDGLKLFDEDFQFISQLPEFSIDVSAVNDTDVVITQGELNQLKRVRVLPDMKVVRTLKMDRQCVGVDVHRDEIYITCHDDPGNGEVIVLDLDGQVLRRLGVDNGKYMFTGPGRVKVSPDGSKLFISDVDTATVTCLNQQGHVVYQYSDTHLDTPVGMFVDSDNNVIVCEVNSDNVHMVRQDGRKEKNALTQKDGICYPLSIAYRQSDGCLSFPNCYSKWYSLPKLKVNAHVEVDRRGPIANCSRGTFIILYAL